MNEEHAASREGLTASLIRILLRWMLLWVVIVAAVEAPFLAANKLGTLWIDLGLALFAVLLPALLLQAGRVIASAWCFVVSLGIITSALLFLARGVEGSTSVLQLTVAVVTAVLLGRNAALSMSTALLGVDLGIAIFEATGGHLFVLFPGAPLSNWFVIAIAFAMSAPPIYVAVDRLRQALHQSQNQLDALKKAEERIVYQAQLIAQSADPVIALDNQSRVTFWNAAAQRLLGRSEQEALGKDIYDLVRNTPDTPPREQIREELGRTGRWEGEVTWLTAAGELRTMDAAITILRNAAGAQIGTVGGFHDITERRRAAEELRRSEERLYLLTETVPVGITMFDRSGHIVFANSFAAKLLEMSRTEILTRSVTSPDWEITDFAGHPFQLEDRPFYRVLKTGQPVTDVHYAVLAASGKRKYLSVSAAPILGDRGEVESVVASLEDITERRELEEQYRHAQRMESMGRLAGGVAHDFNNLLTVINGYSQLLLRRINSDTAGTTFREPLEQVQKAGRRAAELSKQLLAFSRKQVASPSPLLLNDLIADSETMLRRLLGSDVELVARLAPTAGTILADSGQIQQVLMNLLINARDAMPQGGKVLVETANFESSPEDPARDPDAASGAYVLLTVEDTGVGMDPETQKHIFEPFFTTKAAGYGTGLGLATVYGIVKQNQGWVRVESEPGKGARFYVYLPRIDAPTQPSQPLESTAEGGTETILLVDDQPEVRGFLAECLRSYGYNVIEVSACEEALLLSRRHTGTLDMLVTDMVMPGMSGRELAEVLGSERPGLRVLLVSGYSAEQVRPLGLAAARFGFVQKPVSPEDLATKVRRLLETNDAPAPYPEPDSPKAMRG